MSDEPVLTERRDGVLLITLNRPDARNAVNTALAEGIATALETLDADEQRVVAVELVERGGHALGQRQVDRVARVGAVEGDEQHVAAALGEDGLIVHEWREPT